MVHCHYGSSIRVCNSSTTRWEVGGYRSEERHCDDTQAWVTMMPVKLGRNSDVQFSSVRWLFLLSPDSLLTYA